MPYPNKTESQRYAEQVDFAIFLRLSVFDAIVLPAVLERASFRYGVSKRRLIEAAYADKALAGALAWVCKDVAKTLSPTYGTPKGESSC